MNKNKKISKAPLIVSIAILVYIVLLLLLVHVESASPESGITTIQAGLWYTITTLTTVGYGDLYPVTSSGKIIGAVFQLMSLGVLVALFSFMLSFLSRAFGHLRFAPAKPLHGEGHPGPGVPQGEYHVRGVPEVKPAGARFEAVGRLQEP